jgi:DNA primase small subunit
LFNWLGYGNDPNKENPSINRTLFSRREWSFTIEDDIYIRYQSFKDGDEMMKAIQKKQPHKIDTLPDDKIKKELHDCWGKESQQYLSGAQRWDQLKDSISQQLEQQMKKRNKMDTGFGSNKVNLELWLKELVFTHCYPRFDANVSKAQNHLLKSPFCIHPKTGRVCVPIDPANADNFDPFKVPTLRMVIEEINAYDEANPRIDDVDNNVIQDHEKTSLKEFIDIFNKTLMNGLNNTTEKSVLDL